jgi:hypothetical protein
MKYQTAQGLKLAAMVLIVAAVIGLAAWLLSSCTTAPVPSPVARTTTYPVIPSCLVLCFATVHSTVDSYSSPSQPPPKAKRASPSASAPAAASAPLPASAVNTPAFKQPRP